MIGNFDSAPIGNRHVRPAVVITIVGIGFLPLNIIFIIVGAACFLAKHVNEAVTDDVVEVLIKLPLKSIQCTNNFILNGHHGHLIPKPHFPVM